MPRAPRVTGSELVRALTRAGFELDRIKGSHHVLKRSGLTVSVPVHGNRVIGAGLLAAIMDGAELSVEQLQDLL